MLAKVLMAAALAVAPDAASAATLARDTSANLLSADAYFDEVTNGVFGAPFTLTFTADDVARNVSVTLGSFTAATLGTFGITANGTAFAIPGTFPQSINFLLDLGNSFSIVIGETVSSATKPSGVSYRLDVTSSSVVAPIPLPAALPLLAAALGGIAFVSRRRKA